MKTQEIDISDTVFGSMIVPMLEAMGYEDAKVTYRPPQIPDQRFLFDRDGENATPIEQLLQRVALVPGELGPLINIYDYAMALAYANTHSRDNPLPLAFFCSPTMGTSEYEETLGLLNSFSCFQIGFETLEEPKIIQIGKRRKKQPAMIYSSYLVPTQVIGTEKRGDDTYCYFIGMRDGDEKNFILETLKQNRIFSLAFSAINNWRNPEGEKSAVSLVHEISTFLQNNGWKIIARA